VASLRGHLYQRCYLYHALYFASFAEQRDSEAIQLKLDELLRSIRQARSSMIALEERSVEEIEEMRQDLRNHANSPEEG
jgi:low affinity Fe/Cu permease